EYWDCPGFGDTRGPNQEIINAYSIYTLIKNTEKLKVLIVVSEVTIIEKSKKKLLSLIQNLGETFKNNNNLIEGLCLVVTQCKNLKLERMRNGLLKILEELDGKEGFSSSQRYILNFLSSDRSQIAFFNAPQEEGPIPDTDKSKILNCIEKITYINNLDPSISIGSYAKSFIRNLIEMLYNDIEEFISQKFDSAFLNFIKDLIDHHDDTVEKLREHLNGLIEELKKISDVEDLQTFENNLDQILSIVKLLNKNDLEYELSKKISQLKFIKLVKPEEPNIQGNTKSWYHVITKLIKIIDHLKSEPTPESNINEQKLTFKGIIIGTKDIVEKITSKISEINVYSLNSIFIDEDINAPGINLTFISPQLRVVGKKKKINLKGNPGPPHDAEKANDGIKEIINKQDVYDIINENDARDRINQKTDNEVIDETNEKETNDNINKDANGEINKNMNGIEKNVNVLKDGSDEEIIDEQDASDKIKGKETIDGINKDASNEINVIKYECDYEKIGEKYVNDEINEKQASGLINKDANDKLNKNINEVEANNSILKEKSDMEIIGEIDQETVDKFRKFKEENIETSKEKTSDKIKTEETNDLINKVTRENEISDEINYIINNIINKKEASSKMHGKDGSPGNSGYNGGKFYAKGRNFINISSLTIDISGGDGGKGQDGGNGADGLDGSDCGIKIVEERKKSVLFSRKKVSGDLKETIEKGIKFFLTFNEKYKETYVAYDPGQEGGNGGRGGVGGDVGNSGSVWIEIDDKEKPTIIKEKPTVIRENNKKGINGERGSPGNGGKNGPKYCGIYINELVFSGFRDKEFDTKSTDKTANFKELDTKFVDGIRVATNATISTATGLTAAVGCKIAAETAAKNAITFAIKEVGKSAIKISPLTGASFVAGMGVSIAIPLIISPVSAHFSSYWEKEPYKLDDHESFAFNGNSPSSLNENKSEPISLNVGLLDDTKYNNIFCEYYQKDDYKKEDYNIFIKPFICQKKLPDVYY
ncbi:7178_t:CDS:1, partial [Gigaspora rosea]